MLLSILRNVRGLLGKRKQRNSRQKKRITWPAAPGRAGPCDAAPRSAALGSVSSIPGASPEQRGSPELPRVWDTSPSHRLHLFVATWLAGVAVWGCSLIALAGSSKGDRQIREELPLPFPTTRALAAIACTKVRLCRHS